MSDTNSTTSVLLEEPPKYIGIKAEFRPGQTPGAADFNQFLNMLITQGDYNTEWLELIASSVATLTDTVNAQAQQIAELQATVEDIINNVGVLLALHNRGWGGDLNG